MQDLRHSAELGQAELAVREFVEHKANAE